MHSMKKDCKVRGDTRYEFYLFILDDLCSLDFVTRLRLSKLLDNDGRWERLASALDCEHMIEFIKVCAGADEGSPTILLLDQYEVELMLGMSRSIFDLCSKCLRLRRFLN